MVGLQFTGLSCSPSQRIQGLQARRMCAIAILQILETNVHCRAPKVCEQVPLRTEQTPWPALLSRTADLWAEFECSTIKTYGSLGESGEEHAHNVYLCMLANIAMAQLTSPTA